MYVEHDDALVSELAWWHIDMFFSFPAISGKHPSPALISPSIPVLSPFITVLTLAADLNTVVAFMVTKVQLTLFEILVWVLWIRTLSTCSVSLWSRT